MKKTTEKKIMTQLLQMKTRKKKPNKNRKDQLKEEQIGISSMTSLSLLTMTTNLRILTLRTKVSQGLKCLF
jgi:hypothetical protein